MKRFLIFSCDCSHSLCWRYRRFPFFTIRWCIDDLAPGYKSIEASASSSYRLLSDTSYRVPKELDFLAPAKGVTPAVVHVQTSYGPGEFSVNPLQHYLENANLLVRAQGV